MTLSDLVELLGKEMAERAKQAALALFGGDSEIMRARGLILIGKKYEFGLDRDGVLHVKWTHRIHPVSVTWRNPCRHRHGQRCWIWIPIQRR